MTVNMYAFWDAHYRIEDHELRVMVADAFLSMLDGCGWDRKRLTTPNYRHPMTRRKEWRKEWKVSVVDILADFIMRPVQVEERRRDYPVKNADAELYDRRKRKKREISYDSFEESGGQIDADRRVYIPDTRSSSADTAILDDPTDNKQAATRSAETHYYNVSLNDL